MLSPSEHWPSCTLPSFFCKTIPILALAVFFTLWFVAFVIFIVHLATPPFLDWCRRVPEVYRRLDERDARHDEAESIDSDPHTHFARRFHPPPLPADTR